MAETAASVLADSLYVIDEFDISILNLVYYHLSDTVALLDEVCTMLAALVSERERRILGGILSLGSIVDDYVNLISVTAVDRSGRIGNS